MPLRKVTIEYVEEGFHKGEWRVTRERKLNGESYYANSLQDAFDFVLTVYDKDGNPK